MPDYSSCYEYLKFAGVNIKALLLDVIDAVNSKPDSSAKSEALEELHQAKGWSSSHLKNNFDDIYRDTPNLREPMQCLKLAQVTPDDAEGHILARKSLAEIFSLSNEAQEFLEFKYVDHDQNINDYLERVLEIFETRNRKELAVLLDITTSEMIYAHNELQTCQLIDSSRHGISISDTVTQVYDMPDLNISKLFCAPLSGNTLPLDNFSIAHEDLSYITRLLTAKTNAPVHIMLYDPPGTGKTTFARSLARELGLAAWTQKPPYWSTLRTKTSTQAEPRA